MKTTCALVLCTVASSTLAFASITANAPALVKHAMSLIRAGKNANSAPSAATERAFIIHRLVLSLRRKRVFFASPTRS